MTTPLEPSTMTVAPSLSVAVAFRTLKTAGISRARERIAECEVIPPLSVTIAATLSLLSSAVIDGVRSPTTRTVSGGSVFRSASAMPRRILSRRDLMSSISVARCWISSSSTPSNIALNMFRTVSAAASAHMPSSLIMSSIWLTMNGSSSISICPRMICASFGLTDFSISSARLSVFTINSSTAS